MRRARFLMGGVLGVGLPAAALAGASCGQDPAPAAPLDSTVPTSYPGDAGLPGSPDSTAADGASDAEGAPDGDADAGVPSGADADADAAHEPWSPDPSFGVNGMTTFALSPDPNASNGCLAAALAPDGSIVAGGYYQPVGGVTRFAVARFTPNGVPDPAFGAGPLAGIIHESDGHSRLVRSVGFDARGAVLAAGRDEVIGGESNLWLSRFGPAGALDPSFGDGGTTILSFGSAPSIATSVRPLADGKLLVAAINEATSTLSLLRLDGAGLPDPMFGKAGIVTTTLPAFDYAATLEVDPGGAAFVSLVDRRSAAPRVDVVKFFSDGGLDPAFGGPAGVAGPALGLNTALLSSGALLMDDGGVLLATDVAFRDASSTELVAYAPDGGMADFDGGRGFVPGAAVTVVGLARLPGGGLVVGLLVERSGFDYRPGFLIYSGSGAQPPELHVLEAWRDRFPNALLVAPDGSLVLFGEATGVTPHGCFVGRVRP